MKQKVATALAVLLVPLLLAGAFLWGTWSATPRLRQVEAAVVNNDEMVEVNGQMMPLGRQLAAELVNSDREQNFTWVLADEANAEKGLANGRFAAVVVIPKEFSANATSFAGDPDDVKQAVIHVETSPVTGISETVLGQSIANASANALNRFLAREYLKNIYIGFNELGDQFVTLKDGTRQLADGSRELADGTQEAADGVAQLADGVGLLAANSGKLVSGAREAADGAGQYVDGVRQLADGLKQLGDGLNAFYMGVRTYAAGSGQFSEGMGQYASGVHDYTDGVRQYAEGVGQIVTPIRDIIAELADFIDMLPEFSDWIAELDRLADELPDKLVEFDQKVQKVVSDARELANRLETLQTRANRLNSGLAETHAWASGMASGAQTLPCPAHLAEVEGGCDAFAEGVRAGTGEAANRIAPLAAEARELKSELDDLGDLRESLLEAADRLSEASKKMADYAPQLREDIETLRGQIPEDFPGSKSELQDMVAMILDGLNQLLGAGEQLSAGGAVLASGGSDLAAGADQLADGAFALANGAGQLATGANIAATGAGVLGSEGGKLASGLGELADGIGQYADGVEQVADGTRQAADGFVLLADGAGQLADGMGELADGIAGGADEIPSYNPDQRQNMADVVVEPVSTSGLDALVAPTVAWASLLLVAALWLGGLATWIARKALKPTNVTSTASNGQLLLHSLVPGLALVGVQAVLLAVLGVAIIKPSAGAALGATGVLLVAAVAFVSVNHALAAWGGNIGRLVSLFLLVVTTVAALAYSSPGAFAALKPLSPVTPALEALRSVMTGHSPVVPLLLLVGWTIVSVAASGAAVVRSRTVRLKDMAAAAPRV